MPVRNTVAKSMTVQQYLIREHALVLLGTVFGVLAGVDGGLHDEIGQGRFISVQAG